MAVRSQFSPSTVSSGLNSAHQACVGSGFYPRAFSLITVPGHFLIPPRRLPAGRCVFTPRPRANPSYQRTAAPRTERVGALPLSQKEALCGATCAGYHGCLACSLPQDRLPATGLPGGKRIKNTACGSRDESQGLTGLSRPERSTVSDSSSTVKRRKAPSGG